ncbi:HNH endonuclease [Acidovorax sp. LjRoot117]|uniref:HNH endonuclease n=1 Tax=Acidovorax sp. LjRoot117 TaxID=3342255 RepID=UPI003ECED071
MKNSESLTSARLREIVSYDKSTGIFISRIDIAGNVFTGKPRGTILHRGYIGIRVDGRRYLAHRLAWLYVHGVFPDGYIDHINGNTSDNRIENLRAVTQSENMHNTKLRRDNTSGFRGVSMNKQTKHWVAQLRLQGKVICLGTFATPADASAAYEKARPKALLRRDIPTT